jgi:phospholipid/cholesterol/gamma-HCH transport system substrate-binding protein
LRRGSPITWEQVRVGVLILLSLLILSVAVFLIGDTGNVFGQRYQLVTLVRSAAGLVPGASVQLAGQTVGQVDRIDLIPPESRPAGGQAVEIHLAIDLKVQEQIRADSRAQVRTQGLLGDKLIDITPGTAAATVLAAGDTVQSSTSVDYDALIAEGASAVGELLEVTQNLSELTRGLLEGEGSLGQLVMDDELYERVTALAANLDSLLSAASAPNSQLMRLLTDDSLYSSLRASAVAVESLTGSMARGEGTIGQLIQSDSLYLALQSSMMRTDSLLARLQAGEGSAGKMLTDEALYEELLKTVVDLNALLAAVREDPKRYVPPVSVF